MLTRLDHRAPVQWRQSPSTPTDSHSPILSHENDNDALVASVLMVWFIGVAMAG